MRHNKKFNHLSRKKAHRDALLANMTISLIMHKRIFTTLAKAKALRVYAEPLINRAKQDSTPNRRLVFSSSRTKRLSTNCSAKSHRRLPTVPADTPVSSRLATVSVTTPRCASLSLLTTTNSCSTTRLPLRNRPAPVVHARATSPQQRLPQPKLPLLRLL